MCVMAGCVSQSHVASARTSLIILFMCMQVTGTRCIPLDGDFSEAVGQAVSIHLTKTVDQCREVANTPLDDGVCTILFGFTKCAGMEFSRQHVCTLSTSEAVSSTTSSQGTYVWCCIISKSFWLQLC